MKIALCYSMHFAEKAQEYKEALTKLGHEAFVSKYNKKLVGLTNKQKEKLKLTQKYEQDAIRDHFKIIQKCDVILVLNFDKNRINNYIGGNAFLEMGFAYIQHKPIYLLNQIPHMPHYETEIIAMKPTVINGDLNKIKNSH